MMARYVAYQVLRDYLIRIDVMSFYDRLSARLQFDNQFIASLPADPSKAMGSRQVYGAAYSLVAPKQVVNPRVIVVSTAMASLLGFDEQDCQQAEFAELFTGNKLVNGMQPFAMNYGGHQFGHWAGQLGDGRAINLGELVTPEHQHLTLQLKGAGPTPYSRTADGLAVLRSSIREFLCSEAMFYLGIPTTRALSLCLTGEQVLRDMFYDGHPKLEPGAVVCRVSASFMRFGSFQLPASRNDLALLSQLVDYSIQRDFSDLLVSHPKHNTARYLAWFKEVCQRTCRLMVHWQRVGFVHGVMNTDNMSIIGETIDYGPYGWVDNYDPNWTPNTTDATHHRYCFGAQPEISQWNLYQLANAIFPLINDADALSALLTQYNHDYQQQWLAMMAEKIGFSVYQGDADRGLFMALVELLTSVETDMTLFYRQLAKFTKRQNITDWQHNIQFFQDCYYQQTQLNQYYGRQLTDWLEQYQLRLKQEARSDEQRQVTMNAVNPKYVLRNYLAQQAIDAAELGDYAVLQELQQVLQNPYDEQPEYSHLAKKRPDWAKQKAGCSMLSCSS